MTDKAPRARRRPRPPSGARAKEPLKLAIRSVAVERAARSRAGCETAILQALKLMRSPGRLSYTSRGDYIETRLHLPVVTKGKDTYENTWVVPSILSPEWPAWWASKLLTPEENEAFTDRCRNLFKIYAAGDGTYKELLVQKREALLDALYVKEVNDKRGTTDD